MTTRDNPCVTKLFLKKRSAAVRVELALEVNLVFTANFHASCSSFFRIPLAPRVFHIPTSPYAVLYSAPLDH